MDRYPSPVPVPGEELDAERRYDADVRRAVPLDSFPCPECPDPGLCMAEAECPRGEVC